MNKYLILGSSGLIGSRFVELTSTEKKVTPDEIELDITNSETVDKYFEMQSSEFDLVINFAAYTNVDEAEKQRGDENGFCWKLNVEGTKNLVKACDKYGKYLIQISTDFVFKGTEENPGPYAEDAEVPKEMDGLGWYGWTKAKAEEAIDTTKHAIVRTSYPFCAKEYGLKLDFAKKLLAAYDSGKLYPLFTDQIFTPIYIDDLVKALVKISEGKMAGIYHVVSKEATSYWEFGNYLISKARGKENAFEKGSMEEFLKAPGRTPRPKLGGLKTQITQEKLGMTFRSWKEMIDNFVEKTT